MRSQRMYGRRLCRISLSKNHSQSALRIHRRSRPNSKGQPSNKGRTSCLVVGELFFTSSHAERLNITILYMTKWLLDHVVKSSHFLFVVAWYLLLWFSEAAGHLLCFVCNSRPNLERKGGSLIATTINEDSQNQYGLSVFCFRVHVYYTIIMVHILYSTKFPGFCHAETGTLKSAGKCSESY